MPPRDPRSAKTPSHSVAADVRRLKPRQPWRLAFAGVLALGLWATPAQARLNVVTLPGRDTVQLTIYNSVDLTLVKETRHLVFRQGLNKLEFSWANTLIDPTSVELKARTHADAVEVLDVSFPPRVANTLEWRIHSAWAGEVEVEIRYFTSGIRWAADYVAEAARDEKAISLAGQVRVTNQSGEDYENAQVRLVVGVVRLVEQIAQLAKDQSGSRGNVLVGGVMTKALQDDGALGMRAYGALGRTVERLESLAKQKEVQIVKEEMSEYFLYTVDSRDTIPTGWSKRLPSFKVPAVPITSYYKFEREQWSDRVMRYYRFTNSEPSKLGKEPLPDGTVKAFRQVNDEPLLAFLGSSQVKYIPVNEFVELELGADQEVLVKPTLLNWEKGDLRFDTAGNVHGWTLKETWEFELQNSKEIDVVLDIRRNFAGDWDLRTDAPYEKVDATKVKFLVPLKPHARHKFSYVLTTRHGVNVTK